MKPDYSADLLSLFSHSVTVLIVALGHKLVEDLPGWTQIALSIFVVLLIVYLYNRLRSKLGANEASKLHRYNTLRKNILAAVSEYIKERYRISYDLAKKLNDLVASDGSTPEDISKLLIEADKLRVEKVKAALENLSNSLKADEFKKPSDVDGENRDEMKVSFYAVETDPDDTTQRALLPKARYYPREGKPKTRKFSMGQGASGKAWAEATVVVCPNGGDEEVFKEMRAGQKQEYASMICVPAIIDLPAYTVADVYGILTLDSPNRRGYFEKGTDKFWADLLEPICNILIYARESSELIVALTSALKAVAPSPAPMTPRLTEAPTHDA